MVTRNSKLITMKGVFKRGDITVWLRKSFDFVHGYGWHCQYYPPHSIRNRIIGYGFSKNKFTAYRKALKESHGNKSNVG